MIRNILRPTLIVVRLALLLAGLAPAIHAQDTTTGCSLSTLNGTYSVQGQGTILIQFPGFPAPPFPFAEVAIDSIDGKGSTRWRSGTGMRKR